MDYATFEENRPRLWGVAYRMLGSRADAEDMVQEAWLRWERAPRDEVRSPQAWLVTTTTRLCIDRLRKLRAERDSYAGIWLPEPLVSEELPPDEAVELASDISVAFLTVLERLEPVERAAFLLREMFDAGYGEIAQILGKSEVACRQIVSRARKRLRADRPRLRVSAAAHMHLLEAFVEAIRARDREAMVSLLAEDATWTADGGGKIKAARKAVRGAGRIATYLLKVMDPSVEREFRLVAVNGEPGIAVLVSGRLRAIWSILTDGVRILDGYVVVNPDKLPDVRLRRLCEDTHGHGSGL